MSLTDDTSKALYSRAKRLLAAVRPENIAKIKRHDRYWTCQFLELHFERCEHARFERPADALLEVKYLSEILPRIRVGGGAGELRSEVDRMSWRVRCLALEAELAGLAGNRAHMAWALERASAVAENERISLPAGAELLRRQAVIALREGRSGDAARRAGASEALYRQMDPGPGLGEMLVVFAMCAEPEDLRAIAAAEAVCRLSPLEKNSARLWDAAMSLWLEQSTIVRGGPEHFEAISGWLFAAWKYWFSRRSKCPRKMATFWGEGLAIARLGLGRLAQKRMSKAWIGFYRLGLPVQMSLTALDLAHSLVGDGERSLAVDILRVSRERARKLDADAELYDGLGSAEGLSLDGLKDLRDALLRRHLPRVGSFFPLCHPEPTAETEDSPQDR